MSRRRGTEEQRGRCWWTDNILDSFFKSSSPASHHLEPSAPYEVEGKSEVPVIPPISEIYCVTGLGEIDFNEELCFMLLWVCPIVSLCFSVAGLAGHIAVLQSHIEGALWIQINSIKRVRVESFCKQGSYCPLSAIWFKLIYLWADTHEERDIVRGIKPVLLSQSLEQMPWNCWTNPSIEILHINGLLRAANRETQREICRL